MRFAPAIIGVVFAGLVGQTALADEGGIHMLPPQDFNGNPCSLQNNTGGLLSWDGATAIKCIPGAVGNQNGYIGLGTTEPNANLEIASPSGSDTPGNAQMLRFTAGVSGIFGIRRSSGNDALIFDALNYQNAWQPVLSIERNGGFVGIGTTIPQAMLDVFMPNSGIEQSETGATLLSVEDGQHRQTIAAYGGIDGTPVADNTATAVAVGEVSGTGRSITTSGTIYAGNADATQPSLITQGMVGIGLTQPGAFLDIYGIGTGLQEGNVPSAWGQMLLRAMDSNYRLAIAVYGNIDGTPLPDNTQGALAVGSVASTGRSITTAGTIYTGGSLLTNGSIGAGTTNPNGYMLYVNGTAFATGAAGSLSDRRHKKDIEPYADDALAQVEQLKPVTFLWKDPKDDGMKGKQIGFIAQDVQTVVPDAVMTMNNEEKTLSLKYDSLIPVLTKSIQQLESKVDAQSREIEELKSELKAAH